MVLLAFFSYLKKESVIISQMIMSIAKIRGGIKESLNQCKCNKVLALTSEMFTHCNEEQFAVPAFWDFQFFSGVNNID